MGRRSRVLGLGLALVAGLGLGGARAEAFDPVVEAQTYAKTLERATIYSTPAYQLLLRQRSLETTADAAFQQLTDPERLFAADLCASGQDGCAGDVRLYDWQAGGSGIVEPVLWTARSGATLAGHVWATKAGPAKRPAVVITNGSVQAVEQFYWYLAQTLAKAGYVVLTFDPQGQGRSDTPGAGADVGEGVPAQTDGRPFFDGTVDALDFLLSTPEQPFVPRPSCNSGTWHADKQERRVKAGLNAAYNPFWSLVDSARVGIAGHSYGASAVSYVGQSDPRVKALVAYDNLGAPDPGDRAKPCVDATQRAPAPLTKPALGLSADYGLPPVPNVSDPDPLAKSVWSRKTSEAGVDSGELVIRGGTHFDFDWIPNAGFGATLRGADLTAFYTTAWMDKYVKGDPSADARLLSDRWRADGPSGAIDPTGDANTFSAYYRSRLDVRRAGSGERVTCEDLRAGCPGLVPRAQDGIAGDYDFLKIATAPDGPADPAVTPPAAGGLATTGVCTSRRTLKLRAPKRLRSLRSLRVQARLGSRTLGTARGGKPVRVSLRGLKAGRVRVKLMVTGRRDGRTVRRVVPRTFRTCAARKG